MGRVCHGPSLYGPTLLWAEFVMDRVCYGPSCPVTLTEFTMQATVKFNSLYFVMITFQGGYM